MNHPADIRYARQADQAERRELAEERAAYAIAHDLIAGQTVPVINRLGLTVQLDASDLRDYLDVAKLIAANKMAATGSHARAVLLLSTAMEHAALDCGKAFAAERLAYLAEG